MSKSIYSLSSIFLLFLITQLGIVGCARTGAISSVDQILGESLNNDGELVETPVSIILPSSVFKTLGTAESDCAAYVANIEIKLNDVVQSVIPQTNWDSSSATCYFTTNLEMIVGSTYTAEVNVYEDAKTTPKVAVLKAIKTFTLAGGITNLDLFLNVIQSIDLGSSSTGASTGVLKGIPVSLKFNDAPTITDFMCNVNMINNFSCSFGSYADENPFNRCTFKAVDQDSVEVYNDSRVYETADCDQMFIPSTSLTDVTNLNVTYTIEDNLGAKTVFFYEHLFVTGS